MAWYREWFGEEYLELYARHGPEEAERHVDFVASLLGADRPRLLLDLACGAGRHAAALRRRGVQAIGVDLSATLLSRGRGFPRVRADMRALPFAASTFDWVLNFFTSFGYFEGERENFRVLEEIVRVLRRGGRLLIDLFNLDRVVSELVPHETHVVEGKTVEIERRFDAASRRVVKRIRVASCGGPPHTFVESVRAYRADEARSALAWAGLDVLSTFGDFRGGRFDGGSERLILLAAKN